MKMSASNMKPKKNVLNLSLLFLEAFILLLLAIIWEEEFERLYWRVFIWYFFFSFYLTYRYRIKWVNTGAFVLFLHFLFLAYLIYVFLVLKTNLLGSGLILQCNYKYFGWAADLSRGQSTSLDTWFIFYISWREWCGKGIPSINPVLLAEK